MQGSVRGGAAFVLPGNLPTFSPHQHFRLQSPEGAWRESITMRIISNFLLFSVLIPRVVSYPPTVNSGPPTKPLIQSHQLPDSYIVILKDNLSPLATNEHLSWVRNLHSMRENLRLELRKRGQEPQLFTGVKHTYTISGKPIGYSGHFDTGLIEEIRKTPEVNFIENDFEHHFLQSEEPITQNGAPWGLARISHRDVLGPAQYYIYTPTNAGKESMPM